MTIAELIKILLISLFFICHTEAQINPKKDYVYLKVANQKVRYSKECLKFAKQISSLQINNKLDRSFHISEYRVLRKAQRNSNRLKTEFIELKNNDYVVFDFGLSKIKNNVGNDLYIFSEGQTYSLKISLSKDLNNWKEVGLINDEKSYFDLENIILSKEKFKYLKIESLETNSNSTKIYQAGLINSKKCPVGITQRIKNSTVFTKRDIVKLQVKDFRQFDWDVISVKLNGSYVKQRKLLSKRNKFIKLPLRQGENELEVIAISEGFKKPCTVDLKILDDLMINFGTFRIRIGKSKLFTIIRDY